MANNTNITRRTLLSAAGLAMAGGFTAPAAAHHDVTAGNAYPEVCEGPGFNNTPQLPNSPWRVGDACRPHPPAVDPGNLTFPELPEEATVLIGDGGNGQISLEDWNNTSSWTIKDNYVVVGNEPLVSEAGFGDGHYHIEWRVPTSVSGSSQEPGNSGFFLANRYEIQILNNYQNPTYADGYAAAVYGQHPPLVNASRPKGNWQKYDVVWRAPRFADNGDLESPGVVTVYWNDVLVQAQTVLNGPTAFKAVREYTQHPVQAPIKIQDHGQPVHFRNVWYRPDPTPASVMEFEGDSLTVESISSTVEASVVNEYASEMTNATVTLTPPSDSEVTVTPQGGTSFDTLAPGDSQPVSWQVTRPSGGSGPHLLSASTSYTVNGEQKSVTYDVPVYPQPLPEAPPDGASYTKTVLSDRMNNLIDLSVADDGRVFYITRGDFFAGVVGGTTEIGVIDQETGEDTVVLEIPVFTGIRMEDGGQGIALDPNFQENGYIYLYYSPSNEEVADTQEELDYLNNAGSNGDTTVGAPAESPAEPYNLLSRVTMENGSIDPDSETEILRVPVQRDLCCHEGGDIQWGPNGENLYLTTGDNTYSKADTDAPGFAPLDEREGRAYYDAQRSSGDTSDFRGKILRITPQHDDQGSYTIPEGNLKEEYENQTGQSYSDEEFLPEIYVMGVRNPFQAGVDVETGTLLWGDYSADSRVWSDVRGPPGFNEFNRATSAGNYGWPYFSGPHPYFEYNYATEEKIGIFDTTPINDSPHNDGIDQLPPVTKPFIWYPGDWSRALNTDPSDDVPDVPPAYDVPEEPPFPDFEGGAPIGGPVYRYQESYTERGLPPWHDGDYIIGEWGDDWLRTVSFENGDVSNGDIAQIRPFAPDVQLTSPIDLELGPEGMLYVAEYGSFSGRGSKLSRIERGAVQPVSIPFGYNAGGALIDGTVTIDGLTFVANSPAVEVSGDPSASSTGTAVGTYETDHPIAGTQNDALYQTEQFGGNLSYEVTIEDGTYDVVLYFAETNPTLQEGERVFNVAVEGQQVYSPLDILAETERYTALKKTVENVEVTDGVLNISTETISDNSKFSGFAIRESEPELVGHYDASTLSFDDGSAVSTWSAVDGTGPDLTQNNSGAQPTFQTDVTNGNPTVRFEGDGDFINADEVLTDDTTGVTMAAAFRTSDPTVQRQAIAFNGSDGEGNGYGMFINDENGAGPASPPSEGFVHALYGGVNWWWSDRKVGQDQFHVVTMTIPEDDPSKPILRLDGQELTTEPQLNPTPPATPTTQFGIGYDDGLVDQRPPYFAGDIGEVRVYNGELSDAARTQLVSDLGNKWSADDDDGGDVIDPSTTIKLGGDTTEGWIGQAPSSIDGQTNPTLPLRAGETYTVVWENLDGRNHDFDILDAQGNTLVDSERMNVEGATKTVEFTVTPEMAEYYCSVHPIVMRGAIAVKQDDGGDGPPPVVGDSRPTDPDNDGLYEDVNGDGEVNHDDVTALFEHFGDEAVQNNPDAYDFNGNGRLDYDDIVELSNSL